MADPDKNIKRADKELCDHMETTYLNHVFAWLVEGSVNYYKYGIDYSVMDEMRKQYHEELDVNNDMENIYQFIHEELIACEGIHTKLTALVERYKIKYPNTSIDSKQMKKKLSNISELQLLTQQRSLYLKHYKLKDD